MSQNALDDDKNQAFVEQEKVLYDEDVLETWEKMQNYIEKRSDTPDNHNGGYDVITDIKKSSNTPVKKKRGKGKQPKGPKCVFTAYMYFCQSIRSEYPEVGFAEIAKMCGQKWKNLDEDEKQPFIDLHTNDKKRYNEEKMMMQQEFGDIGYESDHEEKVVVRKKRKKVAGAPKNPTTAYMFFCKDMRPQVTIDNPDIGFSDFAKILGAKWKELGEEQRKPYIQRYTFRSSLLHLTKQYSLFFFNN